MRTATSKLVIALVAITALASGASAATITLKQGLNSYAGTDDTTLIQNFANGDYGGRNEILLGPTGAGQQRAGLIRFDVTALDGLYSSIDSMKLRFWVFRTAANSTFNVNLLREGNAGWVEGTDGGGAVNAGVATWNDAQYTGNEATDVDWLGGANGARLAADIYGAVGSFTLTTGTTPIGTLVEINIDPSALAANVDTLTEIIDLWNSSGGANNAGFQIYGGVGQWGVDSSESGSLSERPELVIEYTVPAPASLPAGLALIGLVAMRRRRTA